MRGFGQKYKAGCLLLSAQWKSFLKSWWTCIFLQIPVDFRQNFQEFSCHFHAIQFFSFLKQISQLGNRIHWEFLWIYRVPPEKLKKIEIFKIIFQKNSEILVKSVPFFESFRRKNGFFGQEKCCYFWKMDSFSNTLNRF